MVWSAWADSWEGCLEKPSDQTIYRKFSIDYWKDDGPYEIWEASTERRISLWNDLVGSYAYGRLGKRKWMAGSSHCSVSKSVDKSSCIQFALWYVVKIRRMHFHLAHAFCHKLFGSWTNKNKNKTKYELLVRFTMLWGNESVPRA